MSKAPTTRKSRIHRSDRWVDGLDRLISVAGSLPILTFHSIDDSASVISFSPPVFRRGMARLYESGYRTLNLVDAVERLRQGQSLPPRSFVITFDDGYQNVYGEAFPLLQRYGLSATVFLTTRKKGMTGSAARLPSLD